MPTWDEYIALRLPSGNNSSLGGLYNLCCPQITWYFYNHHFFLQIFLFFNKILWIFVVLIPFLKLPGDAYEAHARDEYDY